MRQFVIYSIILLSTVILSCGKDDHDTNTPVPVTQSLTVSVSKSQISADGIDEMTISVKNESNNDVRTSSTIYLNGSVLEGSKFYTSTPGVYTIRATRNGVISVPVTVTAQDIGASAFTQKFMVEELTGTWCGDCPRMDHELENYLPAHPNGIVVALHGPSGAGDPYAYQYINALMNTFFLSGFPTGIINRDSVWNEQNPMLDRYGARRAPLGIAIESALVGNTINVKAKMKFDRTIPFPLKIIVMLTEDGLVYPQTNYNPSYGPNPLNNYMHNNVLRAAATDIFGDTISGATQTAGSNWEKNYSFNAGGYDISKCKIVVTAIYDQTSGRKGSLNTQIVTAGQNKNFD